MSNLLDALDAPMAEAWMSEEGDKIVGKVVALSDRTTEYGTYIISDGSRYPYRLKYRDPCFMNLQIFPKLLRGNKIADAVAISGSMDLVLGGIDR